LKSKAAPPMLGFMVSSGSSRRLRLRRADRCAVCGHDLAVGETALWNGQTRTVTCLECAIGDDAAIEGEAGASALREYEARRQRREEHAREKLGGLGALLARLIDEPQSTKVWQQGGHGEASAALRLAKHLDGYSVRLLHDRRIPGHGHANIDHLAIGPGGITVIDTKTHRGPIRVERIGGLVSPRRSVLLIGCRDHTRLVDGVESQIAHVRSALRVIDQELVDIRGALCFPDVDGLPLLGQLSLRGIIVDGPKAVARLARRPGPHTPEAIELLGRRLAVSFPPA
jgi:hypothetical protein